MTDSTDNAPKRIAHPYKGPDLPTEVFADPGRHDWYFREKMPDSYARFVRADLAPDALADPRVVALIQAAKFAVVAKGVTDPIQDGYEAIQLLRAALAALSPIGGNDE